jgi:nicotinate-nucleotide adenylyltransferase
MRRVALFGGTFDPVHSGHLVLARRAIETFELAAVTFIPAARPPHKQDEEVTPAAHRFAMLALATQDEDRFFVSDLELHRKGPSFTVDTLRELRDPSGGQELYFMMGSDSFLEIETWRCWEEMADLAHLLIFHRAGAWGEELVARTPERLRPRLTPVKLGAAVPDEPAGNRRVYLFDHEPLPVSATQVRHLVRRGAAFDHLVPPVVHRYIRKYRLYHQENEGSRGR